MMKFSRQRLVLPSHLMTARGDSNKQLLGTDSDMVVRLNREVGKGEFIVLKMKGGLQLPEEL